MTVFSPDPVLADAVATAVCNTLRPDEQSCLQSIPSGIEGIFAVFGDQSFLWGDIPPIVPVNLNEELITVGGIPIRGNTTLPDI